MQEEWIKGALRGDRASCDRLARCFLTILFRYFRSAWQLSPAEAEELSQDAFVEAWSSLKSFQGKAARGWLITIARRVAWKSMKAKRPASLSLEVGEQEQRNSFESPLPTQEELVSKRQQYQKIRGLMADLRLEYREILHLYYMEEFSTEEISNSMDLPMGTVKTWLRRARNELNHQWKNQNLP